MPSGSDKPTVERRLTAPTSNLRAAGPSTAGGGARTSQTRTVESAAPETSTVDSAENESEWIADAWPVMLLILRPEARSHRLIERSSEPDARYRPSGLIASVETDPRCPTKTRTQVPFCTSQRRQVRSLEPVAR